MRAHLPACNGLAKQKCAGNGDEAEPVVAADAQAHINAC